MVLEWYSLLSRFSVRNTPAVTAPLTISGFSRTLQGRHSPISIKYHIALVSCFHHYEEVTRVKSVANNVRG